MTAKAVILTAKEEARMIDRQIDEAIERRHEREEAQLEEAIERKRRAKESNNANTKKDIRRESGRV